MSLTLKDQPDRLQPVINPVPIVYGSSLAAEAGFRYKIDLINSGLTDELSMWIYPDTNHSNYGIYNFNQLLNDLIGSDVDNWDVVDVAEAPNSLYSYNFRVTEYIGSTSGATVTGATNYYVFRGLKQYADTWTITDYVPVTGSTADFLTIRQKREYSLTETAVVNTLMGDFGTVSVYNIMVIQPSNAAKYYLNLDNFTGSTSIITLPIGPKQINIASAGGAIYHYVGGAAVNANILHSGITHYDIWLERTKVSKPWTVSSGVDRIYMDHNCYKHDGVQFLWLGELSTYESYTFRMADIKSFKTKRNEIKSDYYDVNGSGVYTYGIGDRGRKNINVSTTEKHKVLSGWVKDEEAADIMELLASPDVYIKLTGIKSGTEDIYPVIITNTSYEKKTIRNNRLFNYTIEFELAYEKLSNL